MAPGITIEHAARLIAHPLRLRILRESAARTISPSDLASEWGEPIGNVSYHARILYHRRAIQLVKTKPVRGAIEHYYKTTRQGDRVLELAAAWEQT